MHISRPTRSLAAQGREEVAAKPMTDHFLVKKLGREFLVKVRDIDWCDKVTSQTRGY